MPSLTQGVRVTLHRLVDLPRNSGHRLTHLPQHAASGVLLPATRPVCCSQGGLHLGKTQGHESPACWPGTWAAGRLQGELQAARLLLRGPEPRPHPAWPLKQLICPSEGGGSLVLPVSWEDQHVGPHQTQGQSLNQWPGWSEDSGVRWPVTHFNRRGLKEEAGHSQLQGRDTCPSTSQPVSWCPVQDPPEQLLQLRLPRPLVPDSSCMPGRGDKKANKTQPA